MEGVLVRVWHLSSVERLGLVEESKSEIFTTTGRVLSLRGFGRETLGYLTRRY